MYMSAMQIGFSTSDLRHMSYPHILWFLHEWSAMHAPTESEKDDGVREATQADIAGFFGV